MIIDCGLTAEVNQSRGVSPHTRPRRTARPIKNVHVKLPARYPYLALKTAAGLRPWILQDAPNGVESPLGIKRPYAIASDARP